MKIILEFQNGEEDLAEIAIGSGKLKNDLLDFSEWLRAKEKWGEHEEEVTEVINEIRSKFYEILGDHLNED